jgi:hypothetical protein
MNRYRLGLRALAFVRTLLASTAALAGFRGAQQVLILDAGRFANGDLSIIGRSFSSKRMGSQT